MFGHRHEYPFAPFHRDIVADFWSPEKFLIDLGFRECGKTTLVEEGVTIAAVEGEVAGAVPLFRNCLIICAKEELAAELLINIKSEIENNDALLALYGDIRGDTWTSTKITFKSGRCIQARGVGQTMRGTKHRDWRPDLVIINDFEDDDAVLTPEGRRGALRWVLKVLLPACDRRRRRIRIYDTVRDSESVPMMLQKHGWPARFIPISYLDAEGVEQPSWAGHPTITREWLAAERSLYARLGEVDIWEREMMCNAATQADRVFRAEHIRVEAVERTWQAVYVMVDPARTRGNKSAFTGWAAWSWVRNRLIVWECARKHLLPDEIVDLIFRLARQYYPVEVGAEKQGLDQWLDQPVRQRMIRDGAIPYRGIAAVEQTGLIKALQAFSASGEMTLAQECPDLREEMLSFPTGRRDALNALAYATELKPGRLIYEGWNPNAHIEAAEMSWGRPVYLAANGTTSMAAAVLAQCVDGRTTVLGDWIAEGDPGESLEGIVREASLAAAGARLTLIAGRKHWEQYGNVGLVQAARSLGVECRPAGDPARGRELICRELGRSGGNGPALVVSPAARWTLNGFAGGYSRPLRAGGGLAGEASENHYRLLFEGIEAFAGLLAFGLEDEETDGAANYATAPDGRRYRSALPARMQMRN